MKKVAFLIGLIFLVSCVFASSVTREVPSQILPGQKVQVKIIVDMGPEDSYFIIEERYPVGFVAENASDDAGISGGAVKWIEIQGAKSKTMTYDLTAPAQEGDYNFGGEYIIGSRTQSGEATPIKGTRIIKVTANPVECLGENCSENGEALAEPIKMVFLGLLIIIILVIVYVSFSSMKKS
jgi:hypothetical protein